MSEKVALHVLLTDAAGKIKSLLRTPFVMGRAGMAEFCLKFVADIR